MVNKNWNRREILKSVAASSAVLALPPGAAAFLPDAVSDREIQIAPVGPHTIRLTVLPIRNGVPVAVSYDGSLVQKSWGPPTATLRQNSLAQEVKTPAFNIQVSTQPIAFAISTLKAELIQRLTVEKNTGAVLFATGDSPLFGLGEG